MLVLSVATSIDALAVGTTLSLISTRPILHSAIIIGLVTSCLCLLGIYLGNSIGSLIEARIELAGGLILIGIGVKILLEHLCG
jgi:putative Mn2+ efflux pump MntP